MPVAMESFFLLVLALAACAQAVSTNLVPFRDVPHIQKFDRSNRIMNGKLAQPGQFPYQAGIIADDSFLCGGSIIHEKWILTAGHCVDKESQWVVHLGTTDLSAYWTGQKIASRRSHLHPKYSFPTNDIALIELPTTIRFSANIKKITLAASGSASFLNTWATLSGFGRISDRNNQNRKLWHTNNLKIVSNSICRSWYRQYLDESLLCVQGYRASSSCQGDSGGPLVVNDARRGVMQVGVTSFGPHNGCQNGSPLGFANIPHLFPWVEVTTGLNLQ